MEVICQGLPAFWINGWLAAVGATVLDDRIRLHWTTSNHLAVLSAADCDPVAALVEAWPKQALLEDLPIAREWKGGVLPLNVPVDSFRRRVQATRSHPYAWTLSSTLTDLSLKKDGVAAPAPFYPPMPGGVVLQERLLNINRVTKQPIKKHIRNSLAGIGQREKVYGLGFDHTRLGSQSDETDRWVDPIVEMMAFFGLALLPMRGDGVNDRLVSKASGHRGRQRGWRKPVGSREYSCFHWPAWSQPLNCAGIDALLDLWNPKRRERWSLLGVHDAWRSTEYELENKKDTTRAYGAEQL